MKQLFIFGAALFLCACSDNSEIIPSGKLVKQNRPVSSFSVINVSNGIHLTLSQEDKDVAVNVEADDNIIQYIETFTENLCFRPEAHKSVFRHHLNRTGFLFRPVADLRLVG